MARKSKQIVQGEVRRKNISTVEYQSVVNEEVNALRAVRCPRGEN